MKPTPTQKYSRCDERATWRTNHLIVVSYARDNHKADLQTFEDSKRGDGHMSEGDHQSWGRMTTGWPPGLLQDDCRGLSKWFANKPDARRIVRENLDAAPSNLTSKLWPTQKLHLRLSFSEMTSNRRWLTTATFVGSSRRPPLK